MMDDLVVDSPDSLGGFFLLELVLETFYPETNETDLSSQNHDRLLNVHFESQFPSKSCYCIHTQLSVNSEILPYVPFVYIERMPRHYTLCPRFLLPGIRVTGRKNLYSQHKPPKTPISYGKPHRIEGHLRDISMSENKDFRFAHERHFPTSRQKLIRNMSK
jgi:hypothetical protein